MNDLPQKPRFPAILGVIVALLILVPSLLYIFRDFLPDSSYTFLGDRAFGELSVDEEATEEAITDRGGDASKLAYPIIADEFPYPEYIEKYEYLYEGTLPDLSTIDATVYRRVDQFSLPSSLASAFSNLTLGIVPLSGFNDLELLNFSLQEEGGEGYSIYVDTSSNTISISRGMEYWTMLDYSDTLTADDLPADDVLISLANQFLNQYNIDKSSYGEPTVDRSYIEAESWVPDTMSVLYPMVVNGSDVWSMWGQPAGMSVSVSLRTDSVDGMYAPGPYTLEASVYELASDPAEILEVAQRGGLWEYPSENPTVTYTSTLGEPTLVLAEHYQYTEGGTSSILYVPALRFPVVEADPDAPYQRTWVIVPLVRDILDEAAPEPILFGETERLEIVK
ncbi:MAG: hypothetical protein UY76_C0042G0004 [Candidatus Uhrbacteria bacterium GW2011_GWA2_52_8d]|uniref:Uncharacterized protein n=1 Tax=Candidatus Uhrbacteria bacterium GW2011_GWA2_52_8d TaxID=1618979 RepID=A0A0G1ZUS5_9BACT|nr:MAG: hypothetical protein UY76_C0042G0004 [Candidatus Uhrbacteria bacterium GW2011_GWA2_52_8d]